MHRHPWTGIMLWGSVVGLLSCEAADSPAPLPELPPVPPCATLRESFQPCGGTLEMTWRLQGVCPEGAPFPMAATGYCPERSGDITPIQTGIWAFENDRLEIFLEDAIESASFSLPETCLEEDLSCRLVTHLDGWEARCKEEEGRCACEGRRRMTVPAVEPRRVRIEGNEVLVLDDQDGVLERWPFCVQGGQALIQAPWFLSAEPQPTPALFVLGQ